MKKILLTALLASSVLQVSADEGMWMLTDLQKQNQVAMQELGLLIPVNQIYDPQGIALKDAVVHFGGGCTGEVISTEGLVLTNHHCGYGAIQQHSSVEHDYLTHGFWAMNRSEELPCKGLTITYIDQILDVTDYVQAQLKQDKDPKGTNYLSPKYLAKVAERFAKDENLALTAGRKIELKAFYGGNRYYLFVKTVYSDIRMVGAPPSSIGKFGADTDNWMWPRHTCDFSVFRIYADANGEPAAYSPNNVPLKAKKHLAISLKGIEEGDYAMIMGFPGSTNRYLTQSEVKQRMTASNEPRIRIRGARQDVLKKEMAASDQVRIQYASKYARSSNYWKNSIGMNKAIVDNKVLETKAEQEARFARFAQEKGNADYQQVVAQIDAAIEKSNPLLYNYTCFSEVFLSGIEFGSPYLVLDQLKEALQKKDKEGQEKAIATLKEAFADIHNKDYDHEVDRKVAKVLLPLYAEMVPATALPAFYTTIEKEFKGDYAAYVDYCYDQSIFANEANFNKFVKKPSVKAIDKDPMTAFARAKHTYLRQLGTDLMASMEGMQLLHKTYVRGLCDLYAPEPKAPDANFTIRLTYGNVKSYDPKDGVHYKYYTTLKGVMEKEDPNNPEFVVPAKLKEIYAQKDYGRYALANGEMPTCFLTTNDITGGNSGSPVINGRGELIGCAFDGNWESLSGDINFDHNLQRCIAVDIRYVLLIIDKLGGCKHLVDEMTIVE